MQLKHLCTLFINYILKSDIKIFNKLQQTISDIRNKLLEKVFSFEEYKNNFEILNNLSNQIVSLDTPSTSHIALKENGIFLINYFPESLIKVKIKRKISELLMEHLKITKKYSEELTVKLERKISFKHDFMDNDYKSMIKGLIRMIKNNKTTTALINDLINNDYTYMGNIIN
jgi:1-aminocyclopropane-1-carboxylate deaminase/D-cysteine desulfhydrase-like pyridoxal-dependent ACC family enzyme